MSENVTLAPISSFVNDSSAVTQTNANYTLIETAFEDCLSLSGEQPNQMLANLDMNNFNILNLPAPATVNSPVRLTDIVALTNGSTITISTLPTGGAANSILVKNSSTNYDTKWSLALSGLTSLGVTTLDVTGTAVFSGSSTGTTTVQASSTASGTLTLPAATDTLTANAATQTLTNKTIDTAGPNTLKIAGTTVSAVVGTGAVVLANTPTLITPVIGAATGTSLAVTGSVKSSGTTGVGYATGAGGTVTQLTSKSTGVTLNTITGQITMNGASLSGSTAVSFTLTNSLIAATDIIIVNIASGATVTSNYLLTVGQVSAGSCVITLFNDTASTARSDALVLNFAVIKGVTS
jgi:hypothetical protein